MAVADVCAPGSVCTLHAEALLNLVLIELGVKLAAVGNSLI